MNHRFRNREEAGRMLAGLLRRFVGRSDVIVLALPRGGVPVGYEVARRLHVPLDVLIVRKLGYPGHQEFAMGAIASGGVQFINESVTGPFGVSPADIERVARRERAELARRETLYRGDRPYPPLSDKTVILVDDGIATGATMRAAVRAVRQLGARSIVVTTPIAGADSVRDLRTEADEVVSVLVPETMFAIGEFYADFRQTTDEEVREWLEKAAVARGGQTSVGTVPGR